MSGVQAADLVRLGTAYGDDPQHHRITGGIFVCTAPPDAKCRTNPTCDCEVWCSDEDAEDHDDGEHCCHATRVAGQPCWIEPWVNASDLEDCYEGDALDHYGDDGWEWPNGPVTCDWETEYVGWRYVTCLPPAPTKKADRG